MHLLAAFDAQVDRALAQLRARTASMTETRRVGRHAAACNGAWSALPCSRAHATAYGTDAGDRSSTAVMRLLAALGAVLVAGAPSRTTRRSARPRGACARRHRTGAGERHGRREGGDHHGNRVFGRQARRHRPRAGNDPPGLIDVHVHIGWHFGPNGRFEPRASTPAQDILYAAENAYLTLMAGFTTVQSPGNRATLNCGRPSRAACFQDRESSPRSCRSRR